MKIGVVGLGKMGGNLARNMANHNFEVIGYDKNISSLSAKAGESIQIVGNLDDLVGQLDRPRVIWLMVPAGDPTSDTVENLLRIMDEGDILIDGGNSYYKNSILNYQKCKKEGVHFFDCGTSGGVEGALRGGNFMIGGDKEKFSLIEPIFESISEKDGYLYTGEPGSGHYLKMIHNGIEYGMMQAIAEGFEILEKGPFNYEHDKVAKLWNNGSVIRGWLMELLEGSFRENPKLENISGKISSSGEGKWTVEEALDLGISIPVISSALFTRYRSQEEETFSGKVVSSLRNGFGGHEVHVKDK